MLKTNLKKPMILLLVMCILGITPLNMPNVVMSATSFEDFNFSHPAYNLQVDGFGGKNPIVTLVDINVATGKEINGKFYLEPDADVTRAELLVMVMRARFGEPMIKARIKELEAKDNFSDIQGHWASDYIRVAKRHEIVNGIDGNTFNPDGFITRGDMMVFLMSGGDIVPDEAKGLGRQVVFSDVPQTNEYYEYVHSAAQSGLITADANNQFRPYDLTKKIEALEVLARYIGVMEKLEGREAQSQIFLNADKLIINQDEGVSIDANMFYMRYTFTDIKWSVPQGKLTPMNDVRPRAFWLASGVEPQRSYTIRFEATYKWTSRIGTLATVGSSIATKEAVRRISKDIEIRVRPKPIPYIKKTIVKNNPYDTLNASAELKDNKLELKWVISSKHNSYHFYTNRII